MRRDLSHCVPSLVSRVEQIHHLPLDALSRKFYSEPIFDTLATLAIPVVVTKRTPRAARQSQPAASLQTIFVSNKVVNLVPPDGGQHPH